MGSSHHHFYDLPHVVPVRARFIVVEQPCELGFLAADLTLGNILLQLGGHLTQAVPLLSQDHRVPFGGQRVFALVGVGQLSRIGAERKQGVHQAPVHRVPKLQRLLAVVQRLFSPHLAIGRKQPDQVRVRKRAVA